MNCLRWTAPGAFPLLMLLTCAATTLALSSPLSGQNAGFRMEASATAAQPGDAITIDVYIDNPNLVPIGGAQLALGFDAQAYELTSYESPDQLPGGILTAFFDWNGPPPVGAGGLFGCTDWWDGVDTDAVSVVATFPTGGFLDPTGLLFRMELTARIDAPIGESSVVHQNPDFTCLWSGSLLSDLTGNLVPTAVPSLPLAVTDVPPVTDLNCGSAVGNVFITWSSPFFYDVIRVRRDGFLLPDLAGTTLAYIDTSGLPGETFEYSVSGVIGMDESPQMSCTVTVTQSIGPPESLTCVDSGGVVDLAWENPPLGWTEIDVLRDGSIIANLPASATSYTDTTPPLATPLDYSVRGVVSGNLGQPANCTVTVAGIAAPQSLSCIDAGGFARLTWQDPGAGWTMIEVLREGILIATLGAAETEYDDLTAPLSTPLDYTVRGLVGAEVGQPAQCTVTVEPVSGSFIRGDADLDGGVQINDAILVLDSLFSAGSLICFDAADGNDDGAVDIADAITVLNYLFASGAEPPPPFPDAGIDPTADTLDCVGAP